MATTLSESPASTALHHHHDPRAPTDALWTLDQPQPPLPSQPLQAKKDEVTVRIHAAPGILDRRKSQRPKSLRVNRGYLAGGGEGGGAAGSGVLPRSPHARSAGLGTRFPIKLDPLRTPSVHSRSNNNSPTSPAGGAVRGLKGMEGNQDTQPSTPDGASASDAFEDAPENASVPTTPPTEPNGDQEGNNGSGDNELAKVSSNTSVTEAAHREERASEPSPYMEEPSTPTLASVRASSPSKQEQSRSLSPTKEIASMNTASNGDGDAAANDPTLTTINLSPNPALANDRQRSISPTGRTVRPQSPPKPVRSLSRDFSSPNAHLPSTSPRPDGMARTASTRIAGFLGRMGSVRKTARSPPVPAAERFAFERRNTQQSVMSNGGESLATIDDDAEDTGTPRRPTLQAQFLNLRKQEESSSPATNGHDDADKDERAPIERTTSDAGLNGSLGDNLNIKTARSSSTPGPLKSPSLSLNLPPGTASGLEAGPAEEPRPVNWDLWQSVVCEGPAAVARTSGEELNQAIASGIPAAIRGVVWQVLADSKSPEMEDLYRTLKARGTAADVEQQQQQRPAPVSRQASQSVLFNTTEPPEKDWEVASSKSSVHSEHSTPATSTLPSQTSPPPSVIGDDADAQARAKALAEQNKQEAAALTKLEKAIRRDLGSRTSFSKYAQAAGLQDGLFGLCKAYALLDDAVGYPQGVNFIAMPLLFNMTEEEAFTLLVRLMSKYDVRSMFTGDLSGLHLRLYQFERLLEDRDPALYCHLRRRNVGPQLYATQWFLTLFAYRFPLQLVLRVYDLIFSQGLTAILKFGLALMQHNRVALLEMKDMSQLTTFLKNKLFDAYIDKSPSASSLLEGGFFGSVSGGADKEVYRADEMVRDACDVDISDAVLASYTAEWEETQRQTQEREAELENLRTSNGTLSARVKVLEERTEQQDNDHVSIAGDVVRIKVENDGLLDENEGLKVKVEELQKLVDSQPAELEAKFKEEMARVLERNSEVQSENRVLKEEVEEMEKALVDIKLKHAQAQQDHDELTRKWMNVQALLKS